jgi:hypothetical protein
MGKGNNLSSETTEEEGCFQVQQNNFDNNIDNMREDMLTERTEHFGDQLRRKHFSQTVLQSKA